jgi:transposase
MEDRVESGENKRDEKATEKRLERVAAIDVAKASGKVCTRLPHLSSPRRVTKVWDVDSTTKAISALAEELSTLGVERVVVESTSDYWRPFVYLLEAHGLNVWLVNARDVKQVPGRPKMDKLDAVWLARLNERGMLRPSFVPPAEIRQLRDYRRLRSDLTRDRTRHAQRLEKLLEDALIKLSSVATDIVGVSGQEMIEALISGTRDPEVLAGMARGRPREKHDRLVEAFAGRLDDHDAELARIRLDEIDSLDAKLLFLTRRIEELISALPSPSQTSRGGGPGGLSVVERLDEIAGIGPRIAQVIVAEVGLNMAQFPTPGRRA